MKGSRILLICLCVLALAVFCGILFGLPSVTLYEAKSDVFSTDQIDPSVKKLVTTDEAAMILQLMDELVVNFERMVEAVEDADPEYLQKTTTKFGSQLGELKKIVGKLPKSVLNRYTQAADTVVTLATVLSSDYSRMCTLISELELVDDVSGNMTPETFAIASLKDSEHNRELLMELFTLGMEMQTSLIRLQNASDSMASVAGMLERSMAEPNATSTRLHEVAGRFSVLFDDATASSGSGEIIYTMSPACGEYGTAVTITGSTAALEPVTAYIDGVVWGAGKSNAQGEFTLKVNVGRHSAGTHVVAVGISQGFGKTMQFTILPADTVLTIVSVAQGTADDGGYLVNVSGTLKTAKGIAVVNAPVDIVEVSGVTLGTGVTTGTGTWLVSSPVVEGTYTLYASFSDGSFPLNGNQSELETVTIGADVSAYCFILIVVLSAGGFLVWRIVRKRKSGDMEEHEVDEESPVLLHSVAARAVLEDEDEFAGIEPEVLHPALPYPAGIDEAEDIRELYRCVIHAALSWYDGYIDALTPFEAVRETGIPELKLFVERYVYLRYSGVDVSSSNVLELKQIAKNLADAVREDV